MWQSRAGSRRTKKFSWRTYAHLQHRGGRGSPAAQAQRGIQSVGDPGLRAARRLDGGRGLGQRAECHDAAQMGHAGARLAVARECCTNQRVVDEALDQVAQAALKNSLKPSS